MFAVILKDYIYSLFVIAHTGNQIIFFPKYDMES